VKNRKTLRKIFVDSEKGTIPRTSEKYRKKEQHKSVGCSVAATGMTAFLPPNLLSLFAARPPVPYLPPVDEGKKALPPYSGLSAYISQFEDPATVDYSKVSGPVETKEKRAARLQQEHEARARARIAKELEKCALSLLIIQGSKVFF